MFGQNKMIKNTVVDINNSSKVTSVYTVTEIISVTVVVTVTLQ